jgi:serine/threonine protein kinase
MHKMPTAGWRGASFAILTVSASRVQQGTINDILSFRLHDFPPTISAAARDFVFAAMTREPAQRPTPKALLAHPWVTAYVHSVTSLLTGNKFATTGELATEVGKAAGSSEIAVSMLRSIGSMQVRRRAARSKRSQLCLLGAPLFGVSALTRF